MSNPYERGNALFIILLVVMLLGALTWAVSQSTQQQTDSTTTMQADSQIQRLFSQGALLSGALQQMVANGENPSTLYTSISTIAPADTGWDTAPHSYKIYHPYGGGVKYMNQTGTGAALSDTANLANNFKISAGSIVKGVGQSDTGGDVLFTATVSSSTACQRINTLLTGTSTMAVLSNAAFTALITNGTNTTLSIASATCISGCDNVPQACVRNNSDSAYGYYQVLLPQ